MFIISKYNWYLFIYLSMMYRYFLSVEEHLALKSLVLRNNIKYHVAFLSFRSLSEYRIQNSDERRQF